MIRDLAAKRSMFGVRTFHQGGEPYALLQPFRQESKTTNTMFIACLSANFEMEILVCPWLSFS